MNKKYAKVMVFPKVRGQRNAVMIVQRRVKYSIRIESSWTRKMLLHMD